MHSRLRTLSAAAFSFGAVGVLSVSGFAQTDNRVQSVLARSSVTVARQYVAGANHSPELAGLPSNLIVAEIYRPAVEAMRARSPTFRRQCARIAAAPQLLVLVESEPPRQPPHSLARTSILRFEYGRVRAMVTVAISMRTPELIAHELEHVLEQLDGVDLRAKARLRSSGVRFCNCGDGTAFETARAVAMGLRVAHEMDSD